MGVKPAHGFEASDMGTFNSLCIRMPCPRCGVTDDVLIEIKIGDTRHMDKVEIGEPYPWVSGAAPRNGGRPENGTMTGAGYSGCDRCGKDWWMRIHIRNDILAAIEVDSERKGYVPDMTIYFRTKKFDTRSEIHEDCFYGEDLAKWLASQLTGWTTAVESEDWGWAVNVSKGEYGCHVGVYDHDTNDETDHGPLWCLRLYNHTPREAQAEREIETILRQQPDFHDIQTEPLT